ncbi:MAG: hypothetical protein ACXVWZ_11880 [Nocardioides sp.]
MPAPPPSAPAWATSRRGAVAALLVASGTLSACDVPLLGGSSTTPRRPAADPDTALVARVRVELAGLADLVAGVSAAYPDLAPRLSALGDLHAAHRDALGDTSTTPAPGAAPSGQAYAGPRAALATLRTRELAGQHHLGDAAVAAASGDLARLLACMAAGVAQALAVLGGPGGAA